MEKLYSLGKTIIEPKNIIGTKWNGWSEKFCDRMKIEFLDAKNCIYTSKPNRYPMTYTITEGKLLISDIKEPFELRGDVLFHGGLPAFEKAA